MHIFGIFFFSFFYFFSFFRPRGGGGPGTLKVRILKGMLSYACSFAVRNACRRSASGEWPSPVFPHLWHTVDINPVKGTGSDRSIFPGAAVRYSSELIPWILTTFRGRAGTGKIQGIFIGNRKFAVDSDWKRRGEERYYQLRCQKFDAWSEKWITVYQLKNSRLWTDTAIRRWPGVPLQQGKHKVLSVEAVRMAETRPDFQA
ncbi:hypothetical protein ACW7AM_16725 [Klebsiella pneumoniae]